MKTDLLLQHLAAESRPSQGARERVRARMMRRIHSSAPVFDALRAALEPPASLEKTLWHRIANAIAPALPLGVLEETRRSLAPRHGAMAAVRDHVLGRLGVRERIRFGFFKWASAFAILVLLARVSPLLLLAPQLEAHSSVVLDPVRGTVEVSHGGLWQPMKERTDLRAQAHLRTVDGQATIILHDYGVVRLAPDTEVILRDVVNHPGPSRALTTLELLRGKIWVQGMVPSTLDGITVGLPHGMLDVHEGSVSVEAGESDTIDVWSHRATVIHDGQRLVLVSGERTNLAAGPAGIGRLSPASRDTPWVSDNLSFDAVHRREVAQMQLEHRAASAGIRADSALYPLKRFAEKVDVLLTFDPEERLRKELANAETRLNEAAAMIAEQTASGSRRVPTIAEYKQTLQLVASGAVVAGSGSRTDDHLVQSLLDEYKMGVLTAASGSTVTGSGAAIVAAEVEENAAVLSAALPADHSFVLKKTVIEATVALPGSDEHLDEVKGQLLVDTLTALHDSTDQEGLIGIHDTLNDLQPYIDSMKTGDEHLSPEIQKEASVLISALESKAGAGGGVSDDTIGAQPSPAKPIPTPVTPPVRMLTDEEIGQIADEMVERIGIYALPRSRWSQLQTEFRSISESPDQGRILLKLYRKLEGDPLTNNIRAQITKLRDMRAAEGGASH